MNAEIHTLTGAYAINTLSETERSAFEEHLARCAACSKEVAELRETAARLGAAVATPPPESLRPDVLARIRRVRQLPPDEGPIIPLRGRKWPLRATSLAAAAAAVVAIALGIQVISMDRELDRANDQLSALTDSQAQLSGVLAAPDARVVADDDDVSGSIVVSEKLGKLAFVPGTLPETEADETYQLWLIGPDGARSAGLLPDPATSVVADIGSDAEIFGVTVEPEGGSEQPTSDPVVLLALS